MEMEMTYEKYRSEKDLFWSDIPHEKTTMVTKKKKIKKKNIHLLSSRLLDSVMETSNHAFTKKKKVKRHNDRKRRFPKEDLSCILGHVVDVMSNPSGNDSFPLYVKSRNTYRICLEGALNMTKLKEAIEYKDSIPADLQMLTHHGKLIRPSTLKNLQPDDTIHVIVKSKGGMKGAAKRHAPPKGCGLSNSATEEEVQDWLLKEVKVPKHVIDKSTEIRHVDGETLNSYDDPLEMQNELKLPIGLCRKIVHMTANTTQNISGLSKERLESFTSDHICTIAKTCLNVDEDYIRKTTNNIKKQHIDGFVLMLYKDPQQFASDLDMTKVLGRRLFHHARKSVLERLKEEPKSEDPMNKNETPHSPERLDSNAFLSDKLGIVITENTSETSLPACQVTAIHNSLGKGHVLNQMFLFWILHMDAFEQSDVERLWNIIVAHSSTWVKLLPQEEREHFTEGKKENQYTYDGKKVCYGKEGARFFRYEEITSAQRNWHKHNILIVHESCSDIQGKHYKINFQQKDIVISVNEKADRVYYVDHNISHLKLYTSESDIPSAESSMELEVYGDMKDKFGVGSVNSVRPRRFKMDSTCSIYFKHHVLDVPESGSGMIIPSVEFKYFLASFNCKSPNGSLPKFVFETLRFACGCLNRRRNGTIYFGVADDKPVDGTKRKHGEIIGFPIMEDDKDSKNRYTEELDRAKCKYFDSPEANAAAAECIRSPVFVKVAPSSQLPLFVMEVDIEPNSRHCERIKFKVDLSEVSKTRQKHVLYVRDGSATKQIDSKSDEELFALKLREFDKLRKDEESANLNPTLMSEHSSHRYLSEKLCRKLCKGSMAFDSSLWPILVTSKPTEEMRTTLYQSLSFISNIQWSAIFEFDDESYIKGFCKHFFSTSQTMCTGAEVFRDIENNNALRDKLNLPENNVLIFCNGRSDRNLPHLTKYEWKGKYSANVKAAVNFLQQRSVIPEGRTIILFLLFASDFEGFMTIFGEMTDYFRSEQILLICEDRDTFASFKESILLQEIVSPKDIVDNCIVGMTWEQASNSINTLLGVENSPETKIPTSSGATVYIDQKFQESVDSLQIISCTQCEDKTFESAEEQLFNSKTEMAFYQGNRVDWWNFFFKDHVMERHCFRNLKRKVQHALTSNSDKKVVPIFLYHDPGAGGSTLARHILWEFHKDFRCGIITKLQEKTTSDILSFWKHKEKDMRNPVLLLIDSVGETKISFDHLLRLLTTESWRTDCQTRLPVCVFLMCIRDKPVNAHNRSLQHDVSAMEYLPQKVEPMEREWLLKKIRQLEMTSKLLGLSNFKGEYFISFMILHSNFKTEFLKDTIGRLMEEMDVEDSSFKLLMYVALLITYVSAPKDGAVVAIPIECCSELMGLHSRMPTGQTKNTFWENNLEFPLRILLIIEPKPNGSGKQIRMPHPSMAKIVIDVIKMKKGSLSIIAMEFLKSDLLKTFSYAKTFLLRLTVEMLTRRKKEEYNDDENTNFSPLIESIISETDSHQTAAEVLKNGFLVTRDSYIAHQLARVHLFDKTFSKAKVWANKAVEMDPKRSSFLHTLGNVYKQVFLGLEVWTSKSRIPPNDPRVQEALNMAFTALGHFQNASTCAKNETNLVAYHDTLAIIICIARFIYDVVSLGTKGEICRYFIEDYIPKSATCLEEYHTKFKALYFAAMDAVEVLDQHIYYRQCSYASKYSRQQTEEHRHSRFIKRKLPDAVKDFTDYFCESSKSSELPSYIKSDVLKDGWHRRRVFALGGKRQIDIFNFTNGMPREEALQILWEVQSHLKEIKEHSSDDYLSLIAVNIALACLKGERQNSIKELFEYCLQVTSLEKRPYPLNMAYMFIMMFLWPRKRQQVRYNHQLMKKAMQHLFDQSITAKKQKPRDENEVFKHENNVYHSLTLFYLTKGRGLSAFCPHSLFFHHKRSQQDHHVWERPDVKERLLLINGHTKIRPNSGNVSIIVDLNEFGMQEEIELRSLRCKRPELTEKPVSFYLGFALSGPVVCYICPRETVLDRSQSSNMCTDYSRFSEEKLLLLKKQIEKIRKNSQRTQEEMDLLEAEEEINYVLRDIDEAKTFID